MEIPRTDTIAVNELITIPHWVFHDEDKVPYQGNGRNAAPTRPAEWGVYDTVLPLATKHKKATGMGFVLTEGDPYCCIDLDHVYDPVKKEFTEPKAREIIEKLNSYTEFSPSGTGFHIWIRGRLDGSGKGRRQHGYVEIYDRQRYMTVTGKHYESSPETIEPRQDELAQLLIDEFPPDQKNIDVEVKDKNDINDIPLVFDMGAKAPANMFDVIYNNNTQFALSWDHKRTDFPSQTLSDYDFSLLYWTIEAEWEPQQIFDLLIQHRSRDGVEAVSKLDPQVHKRYFRLSYENALQSVRNNRGDTTPEINKAMAGTTEDKLDLFLKMTNIKLDKVIMIGEDPAKVQFELCDKVLTIGTTVQLGNVNFVRMKLLEVCGKVIPTKIKTAGWHRIIEMLMAAAERRAGKVLTRKYTTLAFVKDYMASKMPKSSDWRDDASVDMPFVKTHTYDFVKGQYVFWSMQNFRKYIYHNHDTRLSTQELAVDLSESGCRYTKVGFKIDGKSTCRNLWCINLEDLNNATDISCDRSAGDGQDDLLDEAGDASGGDSRDEIDFDLLANEVSRERDSRQGDTDSR